MNSRTPFRQISRIYSSILALGRWPDDAKAQSLEISQALRANVAAIHDLADQVHNSLQHLGAPISTAEPAAQEHSASTAPLLLEHFRRNLLRQIDTPLLCVDVGARWGVDSALLLLKDRAKLLCFDPDAEECARLQGHHLLEEVEYVPLALSSDGRDLTLHLTKEPACSSIFPPVRALYEKYPALVTIAPERVENFPSTTVDRFIAERALSKPDLIKLDTQGSELDILQGAVDNLSSACMIDIEVEFNPLYEGQALFGDVDLFLRRHGFVLWRLQHMVHYPHRSLPDSLAPQVTLAAYPGRLETTRPGYGQLFWGQAHYVRRGCLATDETLIEVDFARRAAAIASAYGYWDLALMTLQKCSGTTAEATALEAILSSSDA